MKFISLIYVFTMVIVQSCQSQKNMISIDYKAQTRGFYFDAQVKNQTLKITDNGVEKTKKINKEHIVEIEKVLSEIDFKTLQDNISMDDLAVDRAILATCTINYNENLHSYEFDHNNLPKSIQELLNTLQKIALTEE